MEPRYPEVELTWEEQQLLEKLIGLEDRGNLLRDLLASTEPSICDILSPIIKHNFAYLLFSDS